VRIDLDFAFVVVVAAVVSAAAGAGNADGSQGMDHMGLIEEVAVAEVVVHVVDSCNADSKVEDIGKVDASFVEVGSSAVFVALGMKIQGVD